MSGFMQSVMQNGIGGVNCGGIENDIVPGKSQDLAIANTKVYMYLTGRGKNLAEEYVNQGMLTVKVVIRKNKHDRPYSHSIYTVTPLGFSTYSGRACLDYKK